MKLLLVSDFLVRLEPTPGPFTIEGADGVAFSAFHMVAGGLAYCTFSVLHTWATNAQLDPSDLSLEVEWTLVEKPRRVGRFDLRFTWPSLPADRLERAHRAAEACAVHQTLHNPTEVHVAGTTGAASGVAKQP